MMRGGALQPFGAERPRQIGHCGGNHRGPGIPPCESCGHVDPAGMYCHNVFAAAGKGTVGIDPSRSLCGSCVEALQMMEAMR